MNTRKKIKDMTTEEKMLEILSKNCTITIFPRGYPTSEFVQGQLKDGTPFCIAVEAEYGDKIFTAHALLSFDNYLDALYDNLYKKERIQLDNEAIAG